MSDAVENADDTAAAAAAGVDDDDDNDDEEEEEEAAVDAGVKCVAVPVCDAATAVAAAAGCCESLAWAACNDASL